MAGFLQDRNMVQSDTLAKAEINNKGMNTTVATITTPTYNVGVAGMAPVVLLVFFAAIIFTVLGLVEVM